MKKFIILIAQLVDSATYYWLTIYGYIHIFDKNIFEGCALLCTAVFWQRFEKIAILDKLNKQSKEAKHD